MEEVLNVMRHESVFNPAEFDYPIHIIGAGATGSRVFAALVELGMRNISVYDPDTIESHNLANQIYNTEDIGQEKVRGCRTFLHRKLGIPMNAISPDSFKFVASKVTEATIYNNTHVQGGIVFLLTDTMESRKKIFDALTANCRNAQASSASERNAALLVIETRMASTHGAIFTVNPFDHAQIKQWESTLVDDSDTDNIELSPCGTTLSVGTTASLIANYAVWQMMQFFVDPAGMQQRIDLFFKPTLTITSSAINA